MVGPGGWLLAICFVPSAAFPISLSLALGSIQSPHEFPRKSQPTRLPFGPATPNPPLILVGFFTGNLLRGQVCSSLLVATMDDGDLDFSNPDAFLCAAIGTDPPGSCSMDSYFDDILKDTEHHACTHTHTCNPPVHDLSHTHTCVHVHTKTVSANPSDTAETSESPPENNVSRKRPSGNRAAVRKYREKKKAHTASLEEEVVHLRASNQQLAKKLQNHAALEAEVARLRCLLVDIRGRIEGEIGAFPYQRPVKNIDLVSSVDQGSYLGAAHVMNSCDFRCNDQMYCSPGIQLRTMGEDGSMSGHVLEQGACDAANIQCMGSAKSGSTKLPGCGGMGTMPAGCLPNVEKK